MDQNIKYKFWAKFIEKYPYTFPDFKSKKPTDRLFFTKQAKGIAYSVALKSRDKEVQLGIEFKKYNDRDNDLLFDYIKDKASIIEEKVNIRLDFQPKPTSPAIVAKIPLYELKIDFEPDWDKIIVIATEKIHGFAELIDGYVKESPYY